MKHTYSMPQTFNNTEQHSVLVEVEKCQQHKPAKNKKLNLVLEVEGAPDGWLKKYRVVCRTCNNGTHWAACQSSVVREWNYIQERIQKAKSK